MTGRIVRIHTLRDDTDGRPALAQVWVVETDAGKQFLLSVKKGQVVTFSKKKGTADKIGKVEVK